MGGRRSTSRWAAGAALLACLASLAACGGEPAAPGPPVAWPAEPAAPGAITRLNGTLFFLGVGATAGGIHTFTAGGTLTHAVVDASFPFYQTATVSPTGRRYAWVDRGQLWVSRFDGIPGKVGPATLDGFFTPQWSADGTRLIVKDSTGFAWIDATSGEITPLASSDYIVVSADGGHAVSGNTATETYHVGSVGESTAPVVAPTARYYTRFQSLSPNARLAVTLIRATGSRGDVARTLDANAVVDLLTGSLLEVPGGATLRQGFFRADRTAVLRVSSANGDESRDQVLLVSPSGGVLDRVRLPREAADLPLLGYAPPSRDPDKPDTPVEPEIPDLTGTVYLLDSAGVHTLRGGAVIRVVSNATPDFFRTVTLSPDGSRYAWLAPTADGFEARVGTVGGGHDAVGPTTADPTFVPQWSADGASLLLRLVDNQYARVDVASGAVTALPPPPQSYLAISPDGAYAIDGPPTGPPAQVVSLPDAGTTPIVEPTDSDFARIQSLSPNGRHAIVLLVDDGHPADSAGRSLAANAIVDLTTGALVAVPGGGTLQQGFFRADGSLVLRVTEPAGAGGGGSGEADRVLLVSPTGEILGRVDVPRFTAGRALLAYAA